GSEDEDSMRGGAWCANSEDRIHWFEIDARKETEFTGVITQGRDSLNDDYVTSYFLAFSNDSREWTTIHDGYADWLFFGNSDKDTPVMNRLAEPVLARYIRIIPQSWNGSLCMRLEVLGCPLPGEPEFRFTAGLHGNEAVGRELILLLMQYLCKEYKDRNPRTQRLVEGIRIHLVPSLNPDGHERAFEVGSELSSWTTGHFTEDGFDIFQNFPDLNNILWDAEDKGMVPKLTPNHHVPMPENFESNSLPEEEWRGHGYDPGYDHGYDHGYSQGYGHREEEEDDRGQGAGYQYAEPEDEPRVTPDESLFRWLAVSYSSTHLTMTHNYHGSCHGDIPEGALGMVNRAKWKPVTGTPTGDYWRLLNPGEYRVTAKAEGFSSETKLCVVGYEPGATSCSFNLAKSNWDRIKQIMALHGNKPIRLSYGNSRPHNPSGRINHRGVTDGNNRFSSNSGLSPEQKRRRFRIARLRRIQQQKSLTLRSTTLATTTTTTTTTTAAPTTSWYDSWPIGEGESFTPGLDYNYKIDDY
ncbi:hypothetical protein GOODEAATRI_006558, partial [Goodea atripinnis]